MKKILSVFLIIALAVSLFSVSFTSNAVENVTLTFHSNNSMVEDNFRTVNIPAGGNADSFYDVPDAGERFIFKGWYYGKEENARAVDFAGDSFSVDTDIYAHWSNAGVVVPDASDTNKSSVGAYDDFDLTGVQVKAGDATDVEKGGLRFIASLSNSLLSELDALSDSTVGVYNSKVEYGFIAAKKTSVNAWKEFGTNNGIDLSNYHLGYNGANVNGFNTAPLKLSSTEINPKFQGIVSDIDCTASDYSQSSITDYKKYDNYRLYTIAITYPKTKQNGDEYTDAEIDAFKNADIAVRAYLRYYDANGLLRTVYDDYNGTNSYGGISTSYDTVNNNAVTIGYYSAFNKMVTDGRDGTISDADSDSSSAVCSMYISGGTAYMKLMNDVSLSGNTLVDYDADLNMNGKALNAGNYFMRSNNRFNMYNGTYIVGTEAPSFTRHFGELTRITNVSYTGERIAAASMFAGFFVSGKQTYVTKCSFTANNETPMFYSSVFNAASGINPYVVMNDCTTDIKTTATQSSCVYALGSSVEMNNCETTIEQTDENSSATVYGLGAWDCDSIVIDNYKLSFSGDNNKFRGIYARNNTEGDTTQRYFEANNIAMDIDLDDLYSTDKDADNRSNVQAMYLGQGEEAELSDVDIDIATKAPAYAHVRGFNCGENSKVKVKGLNSKITASKTITTNGYTTVDAYNLYGAFATGTANLTISSADIRVPIGYYVNVDTNLGISAYEDAVVTINENDGPVYVQGGNAALNNYDNSKYYISGGHFCSQSHGGAYFGGDAEVTGGTFEVINDGPYVPYEGGLYVTADATVNISGATIIGGKNGIRTKSNSGRTDNPTVTISNTVIKHGFRYSSYGVNSGAGTITLNEGVNILVDTQLNESGGTIIDNRTQ